MASGGRKPVGSVSMEMQDFPSPTTETEPLESDTDSVPEAEPMLDKGSGQRKPVPKPRTPSNPNLLSRSQKSLQSLGQEKPPLLPKPRTASNSKYLDEEKPPLESSPFINPNDPFPEDYSDDRDKETITGAVIEPTIPDELRVGEVDRQPSPTGFLAWVGFGFSLFALACCCVSFASPYWMQAYPMSFNQFSNMGLWEICMKNYMHHKDDTQTIYDGCWWVFSDEAKYSKLREWMLPPWFITCQVLAVMNLFSHFAAIGIVAMVFLHFCPMVNHEYHQSYAMFSASGICFFITILTVLTGVMYGILCGDRQWMPRPDLNFISWGFGFFIIQGIVATASGVCYFLEAQKAYNELDRRDQEYTQAMLDMELSQAYPMNQSIAGSSYAGSLHSINKKRDYSVASYTTQPSFDPFPSSASQSRMDPPAYPGYS